MTRYRISQHFVVEEFDCHDGTRVPKTAHAALKAWARAWGEPLRAAFGPVHVTSGFRDRAYNSSIGGAPLSYHVYDRHGAERVAGAKVQPVAVDVVPARGSVREWEAWALRRRDGHPAELPRGCGAAVGYPGSGFIHLDTGPTRTWAG